jgi:hypothetical protein
MKLLEGYIRSYSTVRCSATIFRTLIATSGLVPGEHRAKNSASEIGEKRASRDIFGNPFRPVTLDPSWLTSTVTTLTRQMYESRDFSAMPILADALQDAGCEDEQVLSHCRGEGAHVRGCFLVDLLVGKS